MKKTLLIAFLLTSVLYSATGQEKIIARQGMVSFFSYTSAENIKAENNQVLSIINLEDGTIAISMLMNAFIFEKALMKEHFNESYIESDIYPKATFEGKINKFDASDVTLQTKMIDGVFKMHGVENTLSIKTKIENSNGAYILSGTFETSVKNYNINIPPLLAGNIAETIVINFRFEYKPYEN